MKLSRSTKFAVIFCAVVSILLLLIISFTDETKKKKEDIFQDTLSTHEKPEVMYAEGDEDAAYNYIENPYILRNTEMPYVGCLELNDEIDQYLRECDYVSEVLTIENAYQKGTIIYFEVIIGNTESHLEVEYDIRYNEYKIILK